MENLSCTVCLAAIIISGIGCQWVSSLTRIPSILLLLLTGITLGPVTGFIDPDELFGNLLTSMTSLSVAIILFEGSMSLLYSEIKKIGSIVNGLVTFGAAASAGATFLLLYFAVGYSFEFSLLQSTILVITGPTVINPMINQLGLKPTTKSILKWEGIVIDPVGAIAAVVVFEGIVGKAGHGTIEVILIAIIASLFFGILIGALGAWIITYSLRKFLIPVSIQSPVTLMILLIVFMGSNYLHTDSGLIAVTIMGFILGNQKKIEVTHIIDFKESLSIILISVLFIILSSSMEFKPLIDAIDETIVLFLFLIFVARPLTVLCSGAFWKLKLNEALFMCCIAPRGIVTAAIASLFALTLESLGYPEVEYLAPITFGIIIATVIFYSLFTPIAAKYLNVSQDRNKRVLIIGANTFARELGKILLKEGYEIQLIDPNYEKVAKTKQSAPLQVYRGTFLEYETKFPEIVETTQLLLALTESNDINSLAVVHFRKHIDESSLYQLTACTEKIQESIMGQRLFDEIHDFTYLTTLLETGYQIKSTKLSPEYTFQDWKSHHAGNGVLLFYINTHGELTPQTTENPIKPKNSGKIIFMTKTQ